MTRKDGDSERGTEDIKDKDIEERKMNRNPVIKKVHICGFKACVRSKREFEEIRY